MSGIIEVKKLFKTYVMGKVNVEVLKDINISVEKGDFISIMGPSGSGKSTLLYLMGGLDNVTSGNVYIKGKDINKMNDKDLSIIRRRDIGFIFQFYNLIPNLTIEENILMPILLDGKNIKKYKEKLNESLEIVGLLDRRKHTPKELSGGQQQRVAIARALINDPDIILADEPIGNLDSKTGLDILNLLRNINLTKNKTIIQVTHSEESSTYGNKVIRLKDGCINYSDSLLKKLYA